jgi:hypothetical protein
MLIPNNGRLLTTNGSTAQWIAQASEVAIPNPSQFIFTLIAAKLATFAILLQLAAEVCYYFYACRVSSKFAA